MAQTGHHKATSITTLRSRADFLAARAGVRASGTYVRMEGLNGADKSRAPRVGYTVTKKNGNAVERNRIKRRLRAVVRGHGAGDMRPGRDYVIISKRDALTAPFDALSADVVAVIAKVNRRLDEMSTPEQKKERIPAHG